MPMPGTLPRAPVTSRSLSDAHHGSPTTGPRLSLVVRRPWSAVPHLATGVDVLRCSASCLRRIVMRSAPVGSTPANRPRHAGLARRQSPPPRPAFRPTPDAQTRNRRFALPRVAPPRPPCSGSPSASRYSIAACPAARQVPKHAVPHLPSAPAPSAAPHPLRRETTAPSKRSCSADATSLHCYLSSSPSPNIIISRSISCKKRAGVELRPVSPPLPRRRKPPAGG
jgi:hypothetical protein